MPKRLNPHHFLTVLVLVCPLLVAAQTSPRQSQQPSTPGTSQTTPTTQPAPTPSTPIPAVQPGGRGGRGGGIAGPGPAIGGDIDETPVVTHHSVNVQGKVLNYTATVGQMPLKN